MRVQNTLSWKRGILKKSLALGFLIPNKARSEKSVFFFSENVDEDHFMSRMKSQSMSEVCMTMKHGQEIHNG